MSRRHLYCLIAYVLLAFDIILSTKKTLSGILSYATFFAAIGILYYAIRKYNKKVKPESKDMFDEITQKAALLLVVLSGIGLVLSLVMAEYSWIYLILYALFLYFFLSGFVPPKKIIADGVKEKPEET